MSNRPTACRWVLGCAAIIGGAGCVGAIDGIPGGDDSNAIDPSDPSAPGPIGTPGNNPGDPWTPRPFSDTSAPSPMPLLTQGEYRQTLRQAFGVDSLPPVVLPNDGDDGVFTTNALNDVGDFRGYVDAAEQYGLHFANMLADSCTWQNTAQRCVDVELRPVLRVLYRSDPSTGDLAETEELIRVGLNEGAGLELALASALSSALLDERFLFHLEYGSDGAEVAVQAISGPELASRLSYFLLDGPPDDELEAAASVLASDPNVLEAQARRLLATSAARDTVWRFFSGWLRIPYAAVETGLKQSMIEETRRFIDHIAINEEAPLRSLFSSRYSFVDADLAEHYGIEAPAADWDRVDFPASSLRAGLLTHASFLSANGAHERDVAWIFRGKAVFERLFCGKLPAPPADAVGTEVESRETDARCAGCHSIMDPMGRIFDRYDENGALFDDEAGDARILGGTDIDGTYVSAVALGDALENSAALEHCFTRMWFRFALGRSPVAVDEASFQLVFDALRESGSLTEAVVALVTSPAFRTLYTESAEPLCR